MTEVDVLVSDARWNAALGDPDALARRAVEAALSEAASVASGDVAVSVALVDDAAVRALNRHWRAKDRPTNVLSFPAAPVRAPGPRPLGDVVLAYETVAREAGEDRKPLQDHVLHLLVHGILHLVGYDHETEDDAAVMESAEVRALTSLGVADPYGDLAA